MDALGHYTRHDDDGNYFSARENLYGLIFGVERLTRSGLTMGLAAAATTSSYESRDTADEGESRSLLGYLYASWRQRNQPGGLQLAAALGAGATKLSADRDISFASRSAHGEHDGRIYSATLQGRYDWTPAGLIIGPTLGVSYVHLRDEGFRESGADSVDLRLHSRTNNSLQSLLGGASCGR
jgi:outer membrane autotransporter protein